MVGAKVNTLYKFIYLQRFTICMKYVGKEVGMQPLSPDYVS